jgi:hypothetical protein
MTDMRRIQILVIVLAVTAFFGMSINAIAAGDGNPAACQVPKKPGGPAITGTVVMMITNGADTDALLRLDYKGKSDVFRIGFVSNPVSGEQMLCDALANNPTNETGVDIKTSLGIPANKQFVITGPPEKPESSVQNLSYAAVPGASFGASAGIMDVKIWLQ